MKLLEPVVHLVGQLSFRNKLHATAPVFGLQLRVPTLALIAGLNQDAAANQGIAEGTDELAGMLFGLIAG